MSEISEEINKVSTIKRGKRKTTNHLKSFKIIFLKGEEKEVDGITEILNKLNDKEFGSEITIKHLALWANERIVDRDIKKMQKNSLSAKDKVKQKLKEFNEKNNSELDMYEYLAKALKIQ